MRLKDTKTGYGWISILLHWLAAILIITLWFIGNSMKAGNVDDFMSLLGLHVSIAALAYVFIWARILWRFYCRHPGPLPTQGKSFFMIGKWTHYLLLLAIMVMLISGPLTVWSGGNDIAIFNLLTIPSPMNERQELYSLMAWVHGQTSTLVAVLVVLHILGTFKHIIFNRDGTFDKIMIASRETGADTSTDR